MRDQIPLSLPLPGHTLTRPDLRDPLDREAWQGLLWLIELPLRLKAWQSARARRGETPDGRGSRASYTRAPFFSR
ncbi:hypothetical protein BJF93_00315 [Xaviernesmea oryzae]|uniref:Uncharacterized protein n=2 Tax=Xaviernesmea oryzae TaxID=464029 RepID=A0A1Q9B0C2_9HYPH|nr:hypothetical protein BJF93_00315 [Xaviernesmea oryzae]